MSIPKQTQRSLGNSDKRMPTLRQLIEDLLKIKLHQPGYIEASFQRAKQLLKAAINVAVGIKC